MSFQSFHLLEVPMLLVYHHRSLKIWVIFWTHGLFLDLTSEMKNMTASLNSSVIKSVFNQFLRVHFPFEWFCHHPDISSLLRVKAYPCKACSYISIRSWFWLRIWWFNQFKWLRWWKDAFWPKPEFLWKFFATKHVSNTIDIDCCETIKPFMFLDTIFVCPWLGSWIVEFSGSVVFKFTSNNHDTTLAILIIENDNITNVVIICWSANLFIFTLDTFPDVGIVTLFWISSKSVPDLRWISNLKFVPYSKRQWT